MSSYRSFLAILFVLGLLLSPLAVGPGLAAEEVTVDGVLHVRNPAEPSKGAVTLDLRELWRRGGHDDDVIFGVTGRVLFGEDGNTYVLDRQLSEIQVFDPEGEWLRTIGREGEGPGEFRNAMDLCFAPGGNIAVLQAFPGKIVQLTPEGVPVGDYPMSTTAGFMTLQRARPQGERLAVGGSEMSFGQSGSMRASFLKSLDAEGNDAATYHEVETEFDFAKLTFYENDLDGFVRNWDVGADQRVYCSTDWGEYAIRVWNPDGSPDRVIERAYTPTKRSDEDKEEATKRFGIVINGQRARIAVEDVDRCVQQMHTQPDGSLWVLSDQGADAPPKGCIATFDVFDPSGVFQRQVHLKAEGDLEEDRLLVMGSRVYVIRGYVDAARSLGPGDEEEEEEEDLLDVEPLEIVCYELPG